MYCITIFGIRQSLQSIFCIFGEFYVEKCDNMFCIVDKYNDYSKWWNLDEYKGY